jgi:hypothetical protein
MVKNGPQKYREGVFLFFSPVSFEFCGFESLAIFPQNLGNFLFEFALNIF